MAKRPLSPTTSTTFDLNYRIPHLTTTHHPLSKLQSTIKSAIPRRFTLFPALPIEIRLQVWEQSLPAAIIHELYPIYPTPSTAPSHQKTRLRSNHRQCPLILHTCREAREIGLKHFLVMSYEAPCGSSRSTREAVASIAPFYYNPYLDTLFLNCVASIFLDIRWFLLDETPKSIAPIKGWQNVALDSLHMAFVAVVASDVFGAPTHRMKELFPDMKLLSVVLDSKGSGRRRLRASLRPGKKTNLVGVGAEDIEGLEEIMGYFEKDYGSAMRLGREEDSDSEDYFTEDEDAVTEFMPPGQETIAKPELQLVKVQRKRFYVGLRQAIRYYYAGGCHALKACKTKVLGGDGRRYYLTT